MQKITLVPALLVALILNFSVLPPSQAAMVDPLWKQNEEMQALANPHPPQTTEDKNRVAFAENVVATLLKTATTQIPTQSVAQIYDSQGYNFNLDAACLLDAKCLQDPALQTYLKDIFAKLGSVAEFKNSHIIPWSFQKFQTNKSVATKSVSTTQAPGASPPNVHAEHSKMAVDQEPMPAPVLQNDEYIIHIYTKMTSRHWYHLDVIVSEDAKGKITFRRFFFFEVPTYQHTMPEGVVC